MTSLKEIYAAKQLKDGSTVYPGYLPGAEAAPGSWGPWLLGKQALLLFYSAGYFSVFVHQQPGWNLTAFDFDKEYALATTKTGPDLNATDTNLKPFAAQGGKLVLYHGWNDPAIPALSTVDYFDGLNRTMGSKAVDKT